MSAVSSAVEPCPSETVSKKKKLFESVCIQSGCLRLQALAGQADVCKGCPGRELCIKQGISSDLIQVTTWNKYHSNLACQNMRLFTKPICNASLKLSCPH